MTSCHAPLRTAPWESPLKVDSLNEWMNEWMGAGSKKELFMSKIFKNLRALPAGSRGRAVQPVRSRGAEEKQPRPARSRPRPSTVLGPIPPVGSRLLQLLFLLRSRLPFKNQTLLCTPNHQQRAGLPDVCDDRFLYFRLCFHNNVFPHVACFLYGGYVFSITSPWSTEQLCCPYLFIPAIKIYYVPNLCPILRL